MLGQPYSRHLGSPTCSLLCASTSPPGRGSSPSAPLAQSSPHSPCNMASSVRSSVRGSHGRRFRCLSSRCYRNEPAHASPLFVALTLAGCTQGTTGQAGARYAPYSSDNNGIRSEHGG